MHRRVQPDASASRQMWQALADDARQLASGRGEPLNFRHALKVAPSFPAPAGDGLAGHVERAFREAAAGMLGAATEERRAIAGELLEACAAAVDAMLFEAIRAQVELSRRISGDMGDD